VPPLVSGRVRKEHVVDQVWLWVVLAIVVVALLVMGLLRSRGRDTGDAAPREGSGGARAEPADTERDGDTRGTATPENGRQGTTTSGGGPDAPTSGGNGVVAADATRGGVQSAASARGPDRGRAAVKPDPAVEGMTPAATGDTAAASEGAGAAQEGAPEPDLEASVRENTAPNDSALAALDAGLVGPAAGAAAVGAEAAAAATTRPGRHPGSAMPAADGSSPSVEFVIKVNEASRRYHTPESPYYVRTRADFWFRSVADAEKAGFAAWNAGRAP
jgi:hypothetical protein